MKYRFTSSRVLTGVIGAFALCLAGAPGGALAQRAPSQPAFTNFDLRLVPAARKPMPAATFGAAQAQLKARVADVEVDLDPLLQSPKFIHARTGFLSGPGGQGRAVSAAVAASYAIDDVDRPVKAFLDEHSGLFGHGAEALASATKTRESIGAHNGLRTVVWQQQLDGIPVFESVLIANITSNGELVDLASQFVPNLAASADAGTPNRASLQNQAPISGAQAVWNAAQNLGENVSLSEVADTGESAGDVNFRLYRVSGTRTTYVRKVWLPMNRASLRLCWEVLIDHRSPAGRYRELIDATTGQVIKRQNLTVYISPATYRVYTSDSPSPFSPGSANPSTFQPTLVPRDLVTISALDTNASPNGWINDGDTATLGNNVDSRLDRNGDFQPDGPPPVGTNRLFDFPLDLTQAPSNYANAAIVQMFYWGNWYHDRLYQLGFTEAAGNFQTDNFGKGGLGGDAMQANAQSWADVGSSDNAFYMPAPDGVPGSVNMFEWSGPTPRRDGDLDAEVILHELTHGTSDRMVGGGIGIGALQTSGMGEGWSDFFALSLLSQSGDNVDGNYAAGGYATYLLAGVAGFTQNYYFGIRHYPYSTALNKNPFTFKDIDPGQISQHAGVPLSPVYSPFTALEADEVHHQGEVWCVTLWDARANLVKRHGYAGNQMMMQLVIDGMKLGPANPNFLQARDAIILADQLDNGGGNADALWTAFAKRGLGVSATSPDSSTTAGVFESFDKPGPVFDSALVLGGNGNGVIDANECNDLFIVLRNSAPVPVGTISARLTSSTAGTFVIQQVSSYPDVPAGGTTTNILAFRLSTASNFLCGTPIQFSLVVKSDLDTRTNRFRLNTGTIGFPLRFDSTLPVPIPDGNLNGISSPIQVSGVGSAISKATVALHITHTFDFDLTLELIGPDGTATTLSAKNGLDGDNYGVSCSPDNNRTIFDDAAGTPITAGAAPFVGVFRPQQPLSVFSGKSGSGVNGIWQLHVVDDFPIDSGVIQCWSLFLSPAVCSDGGGRCPGIDTAIGMTATPSAVILESNLTYTITVTNNGPDIAKGVGVNQTLPASVTILSATSSQGSVNFSSGLVTASLGSLNVRGTATITVVVRPEALGTIFSTATVGSSEPDFDPSNNTITVGTQVVPPNADLALGLAADPDPVSLGGILTYTVSVTNNGPVTATNTLVTNILPATVTFISADVSQGSAAAVGSTVICNLGDLGPGSVAVAAIHARAIAVGAITDSASTACSVVDPFLGNNSASVTTTVTPSSDLNLTMVGSPVSAVRGSNITYTLTLFNQGPSAASGVNLNDTLPPGVNFISANPSSGVTFSAGVVHYAISNLNSGAGAILAITVGTGGIPTNQLPVTLTNVASASSVGTDPNTANNTATVATRVDIARPAVVAAGSSLVTESIVPPNGFVDPGEVVTVSLRLQNIGNRDTTNLVATLLTTNGVVPVGSAVKTYGILPAGGGPLAANFTFTATNSGAGVTAVVQLQDGANNLGTVQFAFVFPVIASFSNNADIIIPDFGAATPYPSTINVSGVSGLIGKLTVTMTNVNHTFPDDVDVLLVGPAGQTTLLMSHAGDSGKLIGVSLTFDDAASFMLPPSGQISSGTYRPSAYGSVNFPSAGPGSPPDQPYTTNLSTFNGTNANGVWSLYVADSFPGDQGFIAGGWSLTIAAGTPVNEGGDVAITGSSVPNPVLAGNNLTYTFNITNNGPSPSGSVAFTNQLPAGVKLISASSTQGNCVTNATGLVTCQLGSLGLGTNVVITIAVVPDVPGAVTNVATATAFEGDLNQGDNTAVVLTTVNAPVADMALTFSSAPNPAVVGAGLVYTINVTNNGPGTAFGTVVTDPLNGFTFNSGFASPALGVPFVTNGAVVCNLGDLAPGAAVSLTLNLSSPGTGTVTNVASVTTLSSDPVSTNNSVSSVIQVLNPFPNIVIAGARLTDGNSPPNGTVDPGEIVTLQLILTNNGTADTANLTATLLATNGVSPVSGAQSYGAMIHGGAAKSNNFTFSATGPNGAVIAATFHLQDGATNLGNLVFNLNLPGTTTFVSGGPISIPESGAAVPYPSTINVSGVTGLVSKITVTLSNLTHSFPDDLDILLVGPSGQKTILLSDTGGAHAITNVTLTLDDAAASALPDAAALVSGTFRPTDFEPGDLFPPSAPSGPYPVSLGVFNASNPNGTWSLYVFDDTAGDGGNIAGGWSLHITTVNPVNPAADLAVSVIDPVGPLNAGANFDYTIGVTNKGPANATGVSVVYALPAGFNFVSSSLGYSIGGGLVTLNVGGLGAGGATNFTATVNSANAGSFYNTFTVAGNETDLNLADNTAQTTTSVQSTVQIQLGGTVYTNGTFQLTLTGQSGRSYIIQASTDLKNWSPVVTNVAVGGSFHYTDSNAASYTGRYYRGKVAP